MSKLKFKSDINSIVKNDRITFWVNAACSVVGTILLLKGHFYILPYILVMVLGIFLDKENTDKKYVRMYNIALCLVIGLTMVYQLLF